mgnify:FL=1
MSTTKTATSYKLSLGVENGVNAAGQIRICRQRQAGRRRRQMPCCGQCHERADEPRSGQRLRYGKGRAGSGGMIL